MTVSKNITLTDEQAKFVKKSCLNLSWFVQAALDGKMERTRGSEISDRKKRELEEFDEKAKRWMKDAEISDRKKRELEEGILSEMNDCMTCTHQNLPANKNPCRTCEKFSNYKYQAPKVDERYNTENPPHRRACPLCFGNLKYAPTAVCSRCGWRPPQPVQRPHLWEQKMRGDLGDC